MAAGRVRAAVAAAMLWRQTAAVEGGGATMAALAQDDECSADVPGGCGVSALQRRAAAAAGAGQRAAEVGRAKEAVANAMTTHKWDLAPDEPMKILFVGNSFTYGPKEYSYDGQEKPLHNLPRFFKFVAESLGQKVLQAEDTLGGCTLWTHCPSRNAEMCKDPTFCQPVSLPRVNASEDCTVMAEISPLSKDYAPCPQRLLRAEYGTWDVIVLQDHSSLPTIERARHEMHYPSISEFAEAAKRLNKHARRRKPLIALYMTWSYFNGMTSGQRAAKGKKGCWTKKVSTLVRQSRGDYAQKVGNSPCMGYSLASGAASGLKFGGDVLVPAGLAWQVARGSEPIPQMCKRLIDEEYEGVPQLGALELPLQTTDPSAVRWQGDKAIGLFRDKGPDYKSEYCDGCHIDHHASAAGMYLNALVFYATLTKRSPIGAAIPDGVQVVDGMKLPYVSPADGQALQRIAHDVVMSHMDTWWKGDTQPKDPCTVGEC